MTLVDGMTLGEAEPGSCLPWEPDTSCCEGFDAYPEDVQLRAKSLAWSTIRLLTGGRVGSCPVIMRPCLNPDPCNVCFGSSWMNPYVDGNGNWKNSTCRVNGSCSCCSMCEIIMPGQTAMISKITIDGYTVDRQLFRIDNGNRLVRQDGLCWPSCQNLSAPAGAIGTLVIEYIPGVYPTVAGLAAAGTLACEYAKACTGGKCKLPAGVTAIVRQGVSIELSSDMWANGTGIREVDAYILSVNPNKLRVAPQVWSPDLAQAKHRIQTSQVILDPPAVP